MEKLIINEKLTEEQIVSFAKLYHSVNEPTIYQNIDYNNIFKDKKRFFSIINENKLEAYVIVKEFEFSKLKFIKFASILSEPISKNENFKIKLIDEVVSFYKKNNFSDLEINLFNSQIDQKKINSFHDLIKKNNPRKTGTILIDLDAGFDSIERNFSSNIRKNIKKGINKGIETKILTNKNELAFLSEIHEKMSNFKKINHFSKKQMVDMLNLFANEKHGFVIGCFLDSILIGGIALVKQGNRIEYFIGISDPDYKKLPITHLAIYNGIKIAIESKFRFFDMGGIVFNSLNGEQTHSISEFKLDFCKKTIEYQPSFKLITNKFYSLIKNLYLLTSNLFHK